MMSWFVYGVREPEQFATRFTVRSGSGGSSEKHQRGEADAAWMGSARLFLEGQETGERGSEARLKQQQS